MKRKILNFIYLLDYILRAPAFYYSYFFNKTVRSQIAAPETIPVIIINYNQLYFLKQNIEQLLRFGFTNIVVIDNDSKYPELLKYYEQEKRVKIIRLSHNYGHMVLYRKETRDIFNEYCRGFYFLTDADVVLNQQMPENFKAVMLKELFDKNLFITKVGVSLDITNIPDYYPLKNKVLDWEKKFWDKAYKKNFYIADIDTTFALYKPGFRAHKFSNFSSGIRIGGDFTATHGGWYLGSKALAGEQAYYFKNNIATSWIFNEQGKLVSKHTNSTY